MGRKCNAGHSSPLCAPGREGFVAFGSVSFDQAVDHQQYHRAHQGPDETSTLAGLVDAQGLAHAAELPETDWLELMPKSDQKALEAMPEIDHNSPEANGTFTEKGGLKQSKGLPAVMYSTKTVAAMNDKHIRIGGYPVPLETDAKGRSTLFFLVPYPGACIHVPPPPPNQLVLVRYPKGLKLDDIYTPLWVTGTLKIEKVDNDLASAAYALEAEKVRVVQEADL